MCSSGTKTTSFRPFITAQIKALLYKQFFYLPKHSGNKIIKNDSIIRLDRTFWCRSLDKKNYIKLENDVLDLIKQHFALFYDHKESITKDFLELRNDFKDLYDEAIL